MAGLSTDDGIYERMSHFKHTTQSLLALSPRPYHQFKSSNRYIEWTARLTGIKLAQSLSVHWIYVYMITHKHIQHNCMTLLKFRLTSAWKKQLKLLRMHAPSSEIQLFSSTYLPPFWCVWSIKDTRERLLHKWLESIAGWMLKISFFFSGCSF